MHIAGTRVMPQNINYRRIRRLNSCIRPYFRFHSTGKPKLSAFVLCGKHLRETPQNKGEKEVQLFHNDMILDEVAKIHFLMMNDEC